MPVITRRRGTPAAVAECYADLVPILDAAARAHVRRTGAHYDDARADANLTFLEAYHTHDPAESDLEQRVAFVVARALEAAAQKAARRNRIAPVAGGADPDWAAAPAAPEPFDVAALARRAGPDGAILIAALLDGPPELDAAFRAAPNPGAPALRAVLRAHALGSLGWPPARYRAAFAAVCAVF